MVKRTLLEQALNSHTRKSSRNFSDEDMDLAIAWATDRVSTGQVSKALGLSGSAIYAYLSQALREAVKTGKITCRLDGKKFQN